jgi:hypothetical protein
MPLPEGALEARDGDPVVDLEPGDLLVARGTLENQSAAVPCHYCLTRLHYPLLLLAIREGPFLSGQAAFVLFVFVPPVEA